MKVTQRRFRILFLCLWGGLMATLVASCAPNPTAQLISPAMVARTEEGIVLVIKEIPKLAELSRDEVMAGLTDDLVAAIEAGDPVQGMEISELQGCAGCHSLEEGEILSGPSWYDIGNIAVGRQDDQSPALYLYNSIMLPNAYIVKRFDADVMPADFVEKLSVSDVGHLLALLLSQTAD